MYRILYHIGQDAAQYAVSEIGGRGFSLIRSGRDYVKTDMRMYLKIGPGDDREWPMPVLQVVKSVNWVATFAPYWQDKGVGVQP